MGIVRIYLLLDPRTEEIRYVGKTKFSLEKRLKDHLAFIKYSNQTRVYQWIKSLLKLGLKPKIVLIELATDENWEEAETRWIKYIRSVKGKRLTNHAAGGAGVLGYECTEKDKEKMRKGHAKRGPMSPERKAEIAKKISETQKGRKKTPEQNEKNRRSHIGIPLSVEGRRKVSRAVKKRWQDKEWAAKRREQLRAMVRAIPYEVARERVLRGWETRRKNKEEQQGEIQ